MRIRPRQHLLDIWQALARHSFPEGVWAWDDTDGRSSVADAERLLCLLYPATEIPAFRLDHPDTTQLDVAKALKAWGDTTDIPLRLIDVLGEFMDRNRSRHSPGFAGGHYFVPVDPAHELTPEQRDIDVVDSYSMSVSLCLAVLEFLKGCRSTTRRQSTLDRIDRLHSDTSLRLTAALVGLLRSFTVHVIDIASPQGQVLAGLLDQDGLSDRQVVERFQHRFGTLRATITESPGLALPAEVRDELTNPNRLFECGWAWSVVRDAPEVPLKGPAHETVPQPSGVARPLPNLHFTVVALDGIVDLLSERTLTRGLLDAEQHKLANALRLRWEITHQYWSALARLGDDHWPLAKIPWRTTSQQADSAYFSLSVVSVLVHDMMRRRTTGHDLSNLIKVMERLNEHGRFTGAATSDGQESGPRSPGVTLPLPGSEALGPAMAWVMSDFPTQLLKRAVQLCSLAQKTSEEEKLLRLAEETLDHVWSHRIEDGVGIGLWSGLPVTGLQTPLPAGSPSWSITERVAECMVAAHLLYIQPPSHSRDLSGQAQEAISEAAHLLGREQELYPAPRRATDQEKWMKRLEADLERAHRLVGEQAGTALALALDVLARLDTLARARGADGKG
ncbi:MAG: hypothetical protein HOV92_39360 [Streptomyces sp.]|nr:hypothetical protein [Streptomyces sp.]